MLRARYTGGGWEDLSKQELGQRLLDHRWHHSGTRGTQGNASYSEQRVLKPETRVATMAVTDCILSSDSLMLLKPCYPGRHKEGRNSRTLPPVAEGVYHIMPLHHAWSYGAWGFKSQFFTHIFLYMLIALLFFTPKILFLFTCLYVFLWHRV